MTEVQKAYRPHLRSVFSGLLVTLVVCFFFWPLFFLLPFMLIYLYFSLRATRYEVRPDGLFVQRGIIAKNQSILLYRQIQNVTEVQGIEDQILGLKTLQFRTMTATSAISGRWSGLSVVEADEIRTLIEARLSGVSAGQPVTAEPFAADAPNPYPIHYWKLALVSAISSILVSLFIGLLFIGQFLGGNSKGILSVIFYMMFFGLIFFVPQVIGVLTAFTYKFRFGERQIAISHGLIGNVQEDLPYAKIQDVVIHEGFIERILGIGNIQIETGEFSIMTQGNKTAVAWHVIPALSLQDCTNAAHFVLAKRGKTWPASPAPLVTEFPLSRKKPVKKMAGFVAITLIVLVLAVGLFLWLGSMPSASTETKGLFQGISVVLIVGWFVLVILALAYEWTYYLNYFYDASSDCLTVRKGVFGFAQVVLPFDRVENVFMDQDLFDRLFGLYDVHLSTVGLSSIRLTHIDGLEEKNAIAVRDRLLERINRRN